MTELGLNDSNRGIGPEENRDIWAVGFEGLRGTNNRRENCYWLLISQNQSTHGFFLHTDVCQMTKVVVVIVAKRCPLRETCRPIKVPSSSSVASSSAVPFCPVLTFLRGLLLAA